MEYVYQKAIALPKMMGAQWQDVDLEETIVSEIYNKYYRCIVRVSVGQGAQAESFYFDMDELRRDFGMYKNTLKVLLMRLAGKGLTKLAKLPNLMKYIIYNDALRAGYSYRLSKEGLDLPPETPKDDFFDLELYRRYQATDVERQDMRLIDEYCLVSVNGLYHRTGSDQKRTIVIDGGRSIKTKAVGHVGITSFYNVGKLHKVQVKPENMFSTQEGWKLKNMVGFTMEIEPKWRDKPFFMVLGGYIVLPEEGVFWRNHDGTYRLNLLRLPYIERLLECQNFINLKPLGLTEYKVNKTNLNLDEIFSDEVIKKYFTLTQSFMVYVDAENLFWRNIPIRQALMPGMFTAYQEPKYPLILGHGRTGEYWKVKEDGHWAITVVDSWYRNYIYDRNRKYDYKNVTSQLAMDRPFFYSQGSLLEMGTSVENDIS